MPRSKSLALSNVNEAIAVMRSKLQTYSIELCEDVSYREAMLTIDDIRRIGSKKEQAQKLMEWCENSLDASEWKKLQAAVRKRKQRKQKQGATEVLSVSPRAFELLKKLAKRDGVTYSQILELYLAKALNGKLK